MKKELVGITLCVMLIFCLGSPVTAGVINQWHGGDRVVYDETNDLYWYPYLKNTVGMTRAGQDTAAERRGGWPRVSKRRH